MKFVTRIKWTLLTVSITLSLVPMSSLSGQEGQLEPFAVSPSYKWTGQKSSSVRFNSWTIANRALLAGLQEYKVHIDWSIQDHGFVEAEIQKVWRDEIKPPLYQRCLFDDPRGRACAMGVAIADAKAGHDDDAFVITRSTQLHNSEAVGVLNAAGVKKVADYLRTK